MIATAYGGKVSLDSQELSRAYDGAVGLALAMGVRDRETACDIVQSAVLRLLKSNYQEQGRLTEWIFQATANLVRDFWIRDKRRTAFKERYSQVARRRSSPYADPADEAETRELTEEAERCVSGEDFQVLHAKYNQSKTLKEIGFQMGSPVGTIACREFRIRRKIREALEAKIK